MSFGACARRPAGRGPSHRRIRKERLSKPAITRNESPARESARGFVVRGSQNRIARLSGTLYGVRHALRNTNIVTPLQNIGRLARRCVATGERYLMSDKPRPLTYRVLARLSRRQLFRSTAIAIGGAALLAESSTPALALVPQQAAGYQDKPQGQQMCSSCGHFQAPSSCVVVEGTISPSGWCRLYAQKS
jgi:hypothetical protein